MKRILNIGHRAFLLPDGVDADDAAKLLRRSQSIISLDSRTDAGGRTRIDITAGSSPRVSVMVIAPTVDLHVRSLRDADDEDEDATT